MSTCTEIICVDHKKHLWIGQRDYIYTAEPETMEALNSFFQEHRRPCALAFTDEHDDEIYGDDWSKYEPEKEDVS